MAPKRNSNQMPAATMDATLDAIIALDAPVERYRGNTGLFVRSSNGKRTKLMGADTISDGPIVPFENVTRHICLLARNVPELHVCNSGNALKTAKTK